MARYYFNFDLQDAETKNYHELEEFLKQHFEVVEDGDLASSFEITTGIEDEKEMRKRLDDLFGDGGWDIKFWVCYSDDQKARLNQTIWKGIIELNRKLNAIQQRGWYDRPK